jgi:hypothetical protein
LFQGGGVGEQDVAGLVGVEVDDVVPGPHGGVDVVPEDGLPAVLAHGVEPLLRLGIHIAARRRVAGAGTARLQPEREAVCASVLEQAAEGRVLVQDDEARARVARVDALHGAQQEGVVDLRERALLPGALLVAVLDSVQRRAVAFKQVVDHHIAEPQIVQPLQVGLNPGHHNLDKHEQFLPPQTASIDRQPHCI